MKSTTTLLSLLLPTAQLSAKPLKVFILAGQSDMEGLLMMREKPGR